MRFGKKTRSNANFNSIVWKDDRILLNDVVFRLQIGRDESSWDLGDNCFVLYKGHYMLEQYQRLFERNPQLRVNNLLELGIYECGSVALWNELLSPTNLSAIDLRSRFTTDYANSYFRRAANRSNIRLHWDTDQANRKRLMSIVAEDFGGSLDMVIDDASHLLGPTLASFETLLPYVRPGGVYVIEDWNWAHLKDFEIPDSWKSQPAPSHVISKLVEAVGSGNLGIDHVELCKPFVALFRDQTDLSKDFRLRDAIFRNSNVTFEWQL